MLIIKLYDNGKLYDTDLSKYITIADLRHLCNYREFKIIHNKSKEDCTRLVLDMIWHKTALDTSKAKDSVMRLIRIFLLVKMLYRFKCLSLIQSAKR